MPLGGHEAVACSRSYLNELAKQYPHLINITVKGSDGVNFGKVHCGAAQSLAYLDELTVPRCHHDKRWQKCQFQKRKPTLWVLTCVALFILYSCSWLQAPAIEQMLGNDKRTWMAEIMLLAADHISLSAWKRHHYRASSWTFSYVIVCSAGGGSRPHAVEVPGAPGWLLCFLPPGHAHALQQRHPEAGGQADAMRSEGTHPSTTHQ